MKKIKANIILLFVYAACAFLFALLLLEINKIPTYDVYAKVTRLGHVESQVSEYVTIDFGKEGDSIAHSSIEVWDFLHPDSTNYIFSKENVQSDSLLSQALYKLQQQNEGENLDSIAIAYKLSINLEITKGSSPFIHPHLTVKDKGVIESEEFKTFTYSHPIDTLIDGKRFASLNSIMASKLKTPSETNFVPFKLDANGGILGNVSKTKRIFFLEDMSQCIVNFHYDSNVKGNGCLKFIMSGASRFSAIYPVPDKMTMDRIVYTDSVKIADIKKNGLSFYALRHDMYYLQYARVFFVITFLGLFLTLFVKGFGESIRDCIKKYNLKKHSKGK